MQWCPYVVGNTSAAQAHPLVAGIRVRATFTWGPKLQKVLGCMGWVSSSPASLTAGALQRQQEPRPAPRPWLLLCGLLGV